MSRRLNERPRERPHELPYEKEEETRKTIREWNERMERLNANDMGEAEPQVTADYSRGYSGLYQYMSTNVMVASGGEVRGRQVQPTNFERWASNRSLDLRAGKQSNMLDGKKHGVEVTPEECREIRRCFEAADVTRDGYLDCEELKTFMECRNSAITHWDAKNLLKVVDPVYEGFINLDQIMFLVFHCGIATENEKSICPNKFREIKKVLSRMASTTASSATSRSWRPNHPSRPLVNNREPEQRRPSTATACTYSQGRGRGQRQAIHTEPGHQYHEYEDYEDPPSRHSSRRVFRPRKSQIIEETIPMDGAMSYFENIAKEVRANATQEVLYHKYREEVRTGVRSLEPPVEEPKTFSGPPGWATMVLHSQDPESHKPPPPFKEIKNVWQEKVSRIDGQTQGKVGKQAKSMSKPPARTSTVKQPSAVPKTSIDALNFRAPPVSPELCRIAKMEMTQDKNKLEFRNDLAKIFDKKSSGPSKGVLVLPDFPDKLKLKSTNCSLKNGYIIAEPKQDHNNNNIPEPPPFPVHLLSPRKSKPLAPKSEIDISRTDILFKNDGPPLHQVSRLEID